MTLIWIQMKIFLMAPCGVRQFGHLKWLPLLNLTCSDRDLCVHVSLPASYACNWSFWKYWLREGLSPLLSVSFFPLSSLLWLDSLFWSPAIKLWLRLWYETSSDVHVCCTHILVCVYSPCKDSKLLIEFKKVFICGHASFFCPYLCLSLFNWRCCV